MMPDILKQEKQKLRRVMRERRRSIPVDQAGIWSSQIAEHFCSWPNYLQCDTVMFYLAMPEEAQTDLLIMDAFKKGKRVCVPLLGEKYGEMSAAEITSFDDLIMGKYNLKMPDSQKVKIILPDSIDLVVVPAVAFDQRGNRLGMGAGYYDRFLLMTQNAVCLGLAWGCQLVDKIPSEAHDVQMQYLLTESGFVSIV